MVDSDDDDDDGINVGMSLLRLFFFFSTRCCEQASTSALCKSRASKPHIENASDESGTPNACSCSARSCCTRCALFDAQRKRSVKTDRAAASHRVASLRRPVLGAHGHGGAVDWPPDELRRAPIGRQRVVRDSVVADAPTVHDDVVGRSQRHKAFLFA